MLKLITDPTVAPIREVNLMDPYTGKFRVRPAVTKVRDNVEFPRPSGGKMVVQRPPRRQIDIEAKGFWPDQVRALRELDQARQEVHVFPNYGRDTQLWAPLTGTLQSYQRATTGALVKTDASFTRANTRHYFDEDLRRFVQVAASTPRFLPSNLGKGFLFEAAYVNEMGAAHPTELDVGWSVDGSGPFSVSWDAGAPTPAPGYTGATRVDLGASAGGALVVKSDPWTKGHSSSTRVTGTVWLRGRGYAILYVVNSSGTPTAASTICRLVDEWRPYTIQTLLDTPIDTYRLQLVFLDNSWPTRAWIGPRIFYENNSTELQVSTQWDDVDDGDPGPFAPDWLSYPLDSRLTEYTVAVCGLLPQSAANARMVELTADGTNLVGLYETGRVYQYAGSASHYVTLGGSWDSRAGQPFVVVARVNLGSAAGGSPERGLTLYYHDPISGQLTVQTTGPTITTEIGPTTLYVGGASGQQSGEMALQHVRFDRRAWSNAEMAAYIRWWTHPALRDLIANTQGRSFVVDADNLVEHPESGRFFGTITLTELDYDPDLVVLT